MELCPSHFITLILEGTGSHYLTLPVAPTRTYHHHRVPTYVLIRLCFVLLAFILCIFHFWNHICFNMLLGWVPRMNY